MTAQKPKQALADDYSWQQEFAPKVTRQQIVLVSALYTVWIAGMIAIAVHRWFVSLQ